MSNACVANERGETPDQHRIVRAARADHVNRHADGACSSEKRRLAVIVRRSEEPKLYVEPRMVDGAVRLENGLAGSTDFVGVAQVEDLDGTHVRRAAQATRAASGTALCLVLAMTAAATSGWYRSLEKAA